MRRRHEHAAGRMQLTGFSPLQNPSVTTLIKASDELIDSPPPQIRKTLLDPYRLLSTRCHFLLSRAISL